MALPSTNVTTGMVRNTLGESTNNIGQLCTSPNVNMWSKWKPVRFPSGGQGLTENQRISQPISETSYGIFITNSDSPLTLRELIGGQDGTTHEYRRPRGGTNEPFRLGDFRGYRQDGGGQPTSTGQYIPGIGEPPSKIVNVGGAFAARPWDVIMDYGGLEPMETTDFLYKGDVYPPGYIYRGILLSYGDSHYWQTGAVNWSSPELKAWLPSGVSNITVSAMEFITNTSQPTLRNATSIPDGTRFYAVMRDGILGDNRTANPYTIGVYKTLAPGSVRYAEPILAKAEFNNLTNQIDFEISFDARPAEAAGGSLDNITVDLMYNGNPGTSVFIGDYQLANGEIKTFYGSFGGNHGQDPVGKTVRVYERSSVRAEVNVVQES